MISHLKLKTIRTLNEHISIEVDQNGFEFIILKHKKFDAAFSLHGAHLIHFQAKQAAPLIYLSKTAVYAPKKAIRGGVPICWPWFGSNTESKQKGLASHGFARNSEWTLSSFNSTDLGIDIEFSLETSQSTKAIWPHDFNLTLKASLTDHVELTLITENTGETPFHYSGALHTYLHIADQRQCSVQGLANDYTDSLQSNQAKQSAQPLHIGHPIDSIYAVNDGAIVVKDDAYQRTISVSNEGNDSVVVWNPWVEGAKAFADMPDDGYQTMLCIESAITADPGHLVAPGESHRLKTVIK
ncbi:D-hexose-6-phosphate mutarotase [Psychromonas sp. B3M02]|uniref:D-hexose-6-phosphate mutarotase n=1 Tax=Psychromonas sp. B3M02 TaxID=2267226 RepID=UPI000DE9FD4C|nr:D-hexose-6-phosphate mutarotase [Psychromonas sp. B3M02]RBW44610.1 D-hexose-6-phosphate mutarotase [Psychromonas sp. B3M02]